MTTTNTPGAGRPLQVGEKMPNFEAPVTGQKTPLSLKQLKGQKVVLYFYPKDATPGCTQEGHDFSKLITRFKKCGAVVFGVSRDSMASHEKFKHKQDYAVDLISDENERLCQIFGVIKDKNMYGKKVRGIERSTFVLDEESVLRHEWRKVKVDQHAQHVLEYVQGLF